MATVLNMKGLDTIRNSLRAAVAIMKDNIRPCMVEITTKIQVESMKRTPVRTGALMGSHRTVVKHGPSRTEGIIYCTGDNKAKRYYALYVHEAPPYVVFRSPWPRGRKFMERAIVENMGNLLGIIVKWLRISRP